MENRLSIGDLGDVRKYRQPLDLDAVDADEAARYLRDMLLIRIAEECIGTLAADAVARTPCHLGIGQEAVAVGVSAALESSDRVFGGHRSHSHFLALGGDVDELMAEVLGKADGASRGMGGSMHLHSAEIGFHGSVPIVGATIPIAVGAGLASRMDGDGSIAVCYFGDGAAEEGVLHESLNLAAVFEIPVLFVCENNLFSSHLDIQYRQPADRIARFADAHCVESVTVDGNDVIAVRDASRSLVGRMRSASGPAMIEAVTYRHRGHVGPNEDIDVGVRRSLDELDEWKQRDPVLRMRRAMEQRGWLDDSRYDEVVDQVRGEVARARDKALEADYPPADNLMGLVLRSGGAGR